MNFYNFILSHAYDYWGNSNPYSTKSHGPDGDVITVLFTILLFGILIIKIITSETEHYYTKSPEEEGKNGENEILRSLKFLDSKINESESYNTKYLQNVYLKYNDKSTEIDIMMITKKGILIIECKNYKGWIFGEYNQRNWTVCYPSGSSYEMYNPIWQNMAHVKYVNKLLLEKGIKIVPVFSTVVFTNDANFKKMICEYTYDCIYEDDIEDLLVELKNKPDVLNTIQIEWLYKYFNDFTKISDEEKENHISEINNYKEENSIVTKDDIRKN